MGVRAAATLSGPDIDRSYSEAKLAFSVAITLASRSKDEATFYVREPDGEIYGRVERDVRGVVTAIRGS